MDRAFEEISHILDANRDKRVCIVGTFCCGKSTLAIRLPGLRDMDEIVFPKLSDDEASSVKQTWAPDVGRAMAGLARRHVSINPGEAVIGTVLFDCDLVVRLRISDELLRERTTNRGAGFEDAKRLDSAIADEAAGSGLPVIEVDLG